MNNLYEYIDPIASPYEAFLFDSTRDLLPIPAHWHYYVELLYVRKGEIEVSLDNVVSTCTKGAVILFPPKCVHSIALARGSSPVQYDVIKSIPIFCRPAKRMKSICAPCAWDSRLPLSLYLFSGTDGPNESFSAFFRYSF